MHSYGRRSAPLVARSDMAEPSAKREEGTRTTGPCAPEERENDTFTIRKGKRRKSSKTQRPVGRETSRSRLKKV